MFEEKQISTFLKVSHVVQTGFVVVHRTVAVVRLAEERIQVDLVADRTAAVEHTAVVDLVVGHMVAVAVLEERIVAVLEAHIVAVVLAGHQRKVSVAVAGLVPVKFLHCPRT